MKANEIRSLFLDFFKEKGHQIVLSAPIVIKNDPTLMFTNAGMNQFKEIFLDEASAPNKRIANTQKCLRVSGKHNDLEAVGVDTYHHTMFEMLGNWSFGDYFKKEAIEWAWELLVDRCQIPKDCLYVTVFGGDKADNLPFDNESFLHWKNIIPENRIIKGSKKDNFWEMGDTGPCGPCSEIHIDLRSEKEKQKIAGSSLINKNHPQVIELWNLVFIEFNRLNDGNLKQLPLKHIDTGMGFERLTMVLQNKNSNYDTDIFQPLINFIEHETGITYYPITQSKNPQILKSSDSQIAMRVMADHIRAISFTIADGELPSNNKAGYVIRRILRRAVRYYFTYLNIKEPFLYKIVPVLAQNVQNVFNEINIQKEFLQNVIMEEENAFLKTLESGLKKLDLYKRKNLKTIDGKTAFELYDTFGFPLDLTMLIAREQGIKVDETGFNNEMRLQKERSRKAANVDSGDWVNVNETDKPTLFVGYETLSTETKIIKYRKVKIKEKELFQLVLEQTPFYAESGGQIGDTGFIEADGKKTFLTDTQKENNLILHYAEKLPVNTASVFSANVDPQKRKLTVNNHSATHLLHAALKKVLGAHVQQKGSLVHPDYLRFDFSHFSKLTNQQLLEIENIVNQKIRENIPVDEKRNVPLEQAKKMGAAALFGEKYGDYVRMIIFDPKFSIELCGGVHVKATGQIGIFKIISESAIAAGIRRIEALTADKAESYINLQLLTLTKVNELLNTPKDISEKVQLLLDENIRLNKKIESFINEKINILKTTLLSKSKKLNGIVFIGEIVDLPSADSVKTLAFELKKETNNLFLILGANINDKAHLSLLISDNLITEKNFNANNIIRELSGEIQGGGGGQPFFATAGGKNPTGMVAAINKAMKLVNAS